MRSKLSTTAPPSGSYGPLVDLFTAALTQVGMLPEEARDAARNVVTGLPATLGDAIERRRPDLDAIAPFEAVEHLSAVVGALAERVLEGMATEPTEAPRSPGEATHLPELPDHDDEAELAALEADAVAEAEMMHAGGWR